MEAIASTVSVLIGVVAAIWCAYRTRAVFPIIFIVAYQLIWTLVSCAYNEQGVYLSDIQKVTDFSGSSFRLAILLGLFFAGCVMASKLFIRGDETADEGWGLPAEACTGESAERMSIYSFGIVVSSICVALLFLNLLVSGSVLTNSGITRFNFYSDYSKIKIAQYVVYLSCGITIFLGSCLFQQEKKSYKVFAGALFILLMVYYRLIGEEAGPLIVNGLYLFLPLLVTLFNKPVTPATKKVIKRAVAVLAVIMLIILGFKQSAMDGKTYYGAENQNSFVYRLMAAQSTTWIGVDSVVMGNNQPDLGQFVTEIEASLGIKDPESSGIWYLMEQIMPASDYARYSLQNATLNAGYPALPEMIFGFVGAMLVVFVDGFLFALYCWYFFKKIVNKQIVRMGLAAVLFQQVCNVVTMGGIWYLSNVVPVACAVALIYIELIYAWHRKKGGCLV